MSGGLGGRLRGGDGKREQQDGEQASIHGDLQCDGREWGFEYSIAGVVMLAALARLLPSPLLLACLIRLPLLHRRPTRLGQREIDGVAAPVVGDGE